MLRMIRKRLRKRNHKKVNHLKRSLSIRILRSTEIITEVLNSQVSTSLDMVRKFKSEERKEEISKKAEVSLSKNKEKQRRLAECKDGKPKRRRNLTKQEKENLNSLEKAKAIKKVVRKDQVEKISRRKTQVAKRGKSVDFSPS